MTTREVRLAGDHDTMVRDGLQEIRHEMGIPADFPADVLAAAETAAALPLGERPDLTSVPFVTIDPAGSTDLDQAVHAERTPTGFRVRYAIADVSHFAPAGGAIDQEARRRGLTLYSPDSRVPLHPSTLSEGAASLLADQVRPAAVWDFDLDGTGDVRDVRVSRAAVRSRAQLSYEEVQRALDSGGAEDLLTTLRDVGRRRQEIEAARGGVDLPVPQQLIERDESGWRLVFRAPLPIEGWNAQISLMTGMAAAELMLAGGVGVLRTMPPPQQADLDRVRRTATALGLPWPQDGSYPALIRSADPAVPEHLAFLSLATTLLRGAGYSTFAGEEPQLREHSAVAAPYAHVTAPLRRLVDRFGTEIALAVSGGGTVPNWVMAALDDLPDLMSAATTRSRSLERESLNLVEAVLLSDRVGERFTASVVDRAGADAFTVVIDEPGVRAKAKGRLEVGKTAEVTLSLADPAQRRVLFESG